MATTGTEKPSSRAISPGYQATTAITTRAGGIVWGIILLVLGVLWFAASARWIDLGNVANLILPFLVIVAGLYLLVTKFMR